MNHRKQGDKIYLEITIADESRFSETIFDLIKSKAHSYGLHVKELKETAPENLSAEIKQEILDKIK